jgi:hypothetical protein
MSKVSKAERGLDAEGNGEAERQEDESQQMAK